MARQATTRALSGGRRRASAALGVLLALLLLTGLRAWSPGAGRAAADLGGGPAQATATPPPSDTAPAAGGALLSLSCWVEEPDAMGTLYQPTLIVDYLCAATASPAPRLAVGERSGTILTIDPALPARSCWVEELDTMGTLYRATLTVEYLCRP